MPCDFVAPVLPISAFALIALPLTIGTLRRKGSPRLAWGGVVAGCAIAAVLFGANFPGGCHHSPFQAPPISVAHARLTERDTGTATVFDGRGFYGSTVARVVICTAVPTGRLNMVEVQDFAAAHCDLTGNRSIVSDPGGTLEVPVSHTATVTVAGVTVDCTRSPCYLVVAQGNEVAARFASIRLTPR